MGGPTSSYTTAGIALRVIAPCRPPYPAIMPSSRWRYLKEDDIHLDIIISLEMHHAPAYHEYVSSFYRLTAASN